MTSDDAVVLWLETEEQRHLSLTALTELMNWLQTQQRIISTELPSNWVPPDLQEASRTTRAVRNVLDHHQVNVPVSWALRWRPSGSHRVTFPSPACC